MRTPRSLLALLLVGALALAGCGGEASPKPAPLTKTPSATPTPSALTSQPPVPEAAKGVDIAAAKAFVGYYIQLLGYATNTGDTRALKLLAVDDCKSCNAATNRLARIYSSGGRVEGSRLDIVKFLEVKADSVGYKVRVEVSSQEETVRASSKASPTVTAAGSSPCTFFLTTKPEGLFVDTWGCQK